MNVHKSRMLQMEIKAINDTAGPNGLIPTLLVFGAYPRLTDSDPSTLTIAQRAAATRKAMDEISKIRANIQVNSALNQRNGPDTTTVNNLTIDSDVLVWRQRNHNQAGKWEGPFKLIQIDNETCKIKLPSGPNDFRSTVVRSYFSNDNNSPALEEEPNELESPNKRNNSSTDNRQLLIHETSHPRRNPARTHRLPKRFQESPNLVAFINETENSPQPSFVESRQKELNGLLENGVFRVVDATEIPLGTRIFNSRFVDEIKNPGTNKATEKSRLVVQAYNDREKEFVLTKSPTIQRVSQRIILALSAMLPLDFYLRDITQAYVQSSTELNRDLYIRPPIEFAEKGTILKVIKPLYGVI